jgi:hypothetical protein
MDLQQQYLSLAYIVLPPSMLDWFDVVDVKVEYIKATGKEIFNGTIDIYLDERDNCDNAQMGDLRPNGFTEPTDYFAPSVLRISPAWYRRIPRLSFSYRCIGTVDGDALSA